MLPLVLENSNWENQQNYSAPSEYADENRFEGSNVGMDLIPAFGVLQNQLWDENVTNYLLPHFNTTLKDSQTSSRYDNYRNETAEDREFEKSLLRIALVHFTHVSLSGKTVQNIIDGFNLDRALHYSLCAIGCLFSAHPHLQKYQISKEMKEGQSLREEASRAFVTLGEVAFRNSALDNNDTCRVLFLLGSAAYALGDGVQAMSFNRNLRLLILGEALNFIHKHHLFSPYNFDPKYTATLSIDDFQFTESKPSEAICWDESERTERRELWTLLARNDAYLSLLMGVPLTINDDAFNHILADDELSGKAGDCKANFESESRLVVDYLKLTPDEIEPDNDIIVPEEMEEKFRLFSIWDGTLFEKASRSLLHSTILSYSPAMRKENVQRENHLLKHVRDAIKYTRNMRAVAYRNDSKTEMEILHFKLINWYKDYIESDNSDGEFVSLGYYAGLTARFENEATLCLSDVKRSAQMLVFAVGIIALHLPLVSITGEPSAPIRLFALDAPECKWTSLEVILASFYLAMRLTVRVSGSGETPGPAGSGVGTLIHLYFISSAALVASQSDENVKSCILSIAIPRIERIAKFIPAGKYFLGRLLASLNK